MFEKVNYFTSTSSTKVLKIMSTSQVKISQAINGNLQEVQGKFDKARQRVSLTCGMVLNNKYPYHT